MNNKNPASHTLVEGMRYGLHFLFEPQLIIRDGDRQGLFLPSVWKQLPDRREFLNNLKLKAGLSPNYWSENIKVYRFRTLEIKKNEN